METSEIRQRIVHMLERSKRLSASHREEADRVAKQFETLLPAAATSWKQAASALRAEGLLYAVQTPANLLRFASDRSGEDFIEVGVDAARRPPAVVAHTRLVRGHRVIDRETVIAEGDAVANLTEEHLLDVLLTELEPFLERA